MEGKRIKYFYTILSWIVLIVFSTFQFFGENKFRVLHCYLEIPLTGVCCIVSTFLCVRTFRLLIHPLFYHDFWRLAFKLTCLITIFSANVKFPIFYSEWILTALYAVIDIKSDQLWLLFESLTQIFELWFCLDCYLDLEKIEAYCLEQYVKIKPIGAFGVEMNFITVAQIDELLGIQQELLKRQLEEVNGAS